jgi:hypothetical protein
MVKTAYPILYEVMNLIYFCRVPIFTYSPSIDDGLRSASSLLTVAAHSNRHTTGRSTCSGRNRPPFRNSSAVSPRVPYRDPNRRAVVLRCALLPSASRSPDRFIPVGGPSLHRIEMVRGSLSAFVNCNAPRPLSA